MWEKAELKFKIGDMVEHATERGPKMIVVLRMLIEGEGGCTKRYAMTAFDVTGKMGCFEMSETELKLYSE